MFRSAALGAVAASTMLVLAMGAAPSAQAAVPALAAVTAPIVNLTSLYSSGDPSAAVVGSADSGAATLRATSSLKNGVAVSVPGATAATSSVIEVVPPSGQLLAPGRYPALSSTAADDAKPRLTVTVGNTSYPVVAGEVDVLDIAANADGTIKRFDIVFRTGDRAPTTVLFGELRLGQPDDTTPVLATRHVEWPQTPVRSTPIVVTERMHNTSSSAVTIGAVAVTAGARADYTISGDQCSNRPLASGASCSLKIGFSPTASGPRVATLSLPVGSSTQTVSLAGTSPLGTNSLVISGRDYVDGGTTHTLGGSAFTVTGMANLSTVGGFSFTPLAPNGADPGTAMARFSTAGGGSAALPVGTYPAASFQASTHPSATAKPYGVTVSGFGRGCGDNTGTLTVRQFVLNPDGSPALVDLSFTQKCASESAVMTGTLQYHNRTDVTPPASVTGVSVSGGTGAATRTATWKASTASDTAFTVSRLVAGTGADATPTSGFALGANTLTSTPLPQLIAGQKYTVVVFAVDTAGNYSSPASLAITG
ncbi:hypothetical protein B7R25_03930 [Subtercola boreus]|uniref:Fibronectin type-III domain-containing protein n=1 Tax=Subtercola boreus TaxID=120213 RepID=A0A3E0WEH8_9MICO|nr:hypothetical protein B7R24_03920 [Subtercola boreus]RFA23114.1 hypothetical protein B7R23_03915 [Subtercola boreus]RFA28867.1 hypothetical protein B7R25_03930 [Subtercola boreus]